MGLWCVAPRNCFPIGEEYKSEQERLMNYTADRSDPRPAAERGAKAIAEYLDG